MTALALALLLQFVRSGAAGDFVKGSFHQHASQPWDECHRAANHFPACGCCGCEGQQDWFGVAANMVLESIADSGQGYDFVGLTGNEEPPFPPTNTRGLVWLNVTESQMADVGTQPWVCEPVPPEGSGPWERGGDPISRYVHRSFIQGVPGFWLQHPDADPHDYYMMDYALSGHGNLRGLEIFSRWSFEAWDAEVPLHDAAIDPLYPNFVGMCTHYWDRVLRTLKRPIYGLADDDGFISFLGDTWDQVYPHTPQDTMQTYTAAWFRFGSGWSMVEVPSRKTFTAADVSAAVDAGRFYASSGVRLDHDTSGADIIHVKAEEPVVFAATGAGGTASHDGTPLAGFNLTLCADRAVRGRVTNVGCRRWAPRAPPAARELRIDLNSIPADLRGELFYVRVQARVLRRFTITSPPTVKRLHLNSSRWGLGSTQAEWRDQCAAWEFMVDTAPSPDDLWEGRLVHVAGVTARRPLVVSGVEGNRVSTVSCFNEKHSQGTVTPNSGWGGHTSVEGIVAGEHQLFTQRWAWLQPVFRSVDRKGALTDPFGR